MIKYILILFLLVKTASNVPFGPYTCDMFEKSEYGVKSKWLVSQEYPYKIVYMEIKNKEGYTSKLQIRED